MTLIEGTSADQLDAAATSPGHPLAPLGPAELSAAAAVIRGAEQFPEGTRFVYLELAEPDKDVVASWTPGSSWDRQARAVLRSPRERATYECVASLTSGSLVSWRLVEGQQPPMTAEEFMACEDVVRADPRWQAAMRSRGV